MLTNLLTNLLTNFNTPQSSYRPMYFWFLNHDLNIDEMKRQLLSMKKAGAGGVFLHARHGRITPYMGEKWLQLHTEIVEYGKSLDLIMYLYDEDGFPSGFCGGQTIEKNPKDYSANFIILQEEYEVESGDKVEIILPPTNEFSELYGIVALPVIDGDFNYILKKYPEGMIDLTDLAKNPSENSINWTAPDGEELWLVLVFIREWNTRAANVLYREAMGEFIRLTHEKYWKSFAQAGMQEYFGTIIPGIFTDEPGVMYCRGDKSLRRIIPYSPDLDLKYKEKYDLALLKGLIAVFFDPEDDNPQHRLNYWNLIGDMYSDAFFKQITEWCEDHNIVLTGHVANEGNLFNQIRDQIDFFKVAKNIGFGAMDQLGGTFRAEFEKNYSLALVDNMVSPRFASSAARIYQKPRTLSECFGSTAWNMSLEIQKTLIDWQVIQGGVNLFTPHDFIYSLEGSRKRDHPPSFNTCSYFSELSVLNDYIGRLCYLFSLSTTKGLPRVGVIYGNQTILANMNPAMMQDAYDTHDALPYLVDILQRIQVDFDILPEDYINEMQISENLLTDSNNCYDIIIIPSLTILQRDTLDKLLQFQKEGGKILFIRKLPYYFLENNNKLVRITALYDHFGIEMEQLRTSLKISEHILEKNHTISVKNQNSGFMGFLQAPKIPLFKNHLLTPLLELLKEFHVCEHEILNSNGENNGDIIVRTHHLANPMNTIILLVANISTNSYPNQTLRMRYPQKISKESLNLYYLNLITGKTDLIKSDDWTFNNENMIEMQWSFNIAESLCLLVTPEKISENQDIFVKKNETLQLSEIEADVKIEIPKDSWELAPEKLNILNLNQWKTLFNASPMPGERQSYLESSLIFEIQLDIVSVPSIFHVILDSLSQISRNSIKIEINDKIIKNLRNGELLDFHMLETANLSKFLEKGLNTLRIIQIGRLSQKILGISEPIRIAGNFLAYKEKVENDSPWRIESHDDCIKVLEYDLRKNGFPHYIQPIKYLMKFKLSDIDSMDFYLKIPNIGKPMCKVSVNGKLINTLWFGEYLIPLENIQTNSNDLEIVFYPYPSNLFETPGVPLGITDSIQILGYQR
jgi:hypothetical protein